MHSKMVYEMKKEEKMAEREAKSCRGKIDFYSSNLQSTLSNSKNDYSRLLPTEILQNKRDGKDLLALSPPPRPEWRQKHL